MSIHLPFKNAMTMISGSANSCFGSKLYIFFRIQKLFFDISLDFIRQK